MRAASMLYVLIPGMLPLGGVGKFQLVGCSRIADLSILNKPFLVTGQTFLCTFPTECRGFGAALRLIIKSESLRCKFVSEGVCGSSAFLHWPQSLYFRF
jgi:hypothetical protein